MVYTQLPHSFTVANFSFTLILLKVTPPNHCLVPLFTQEYNHTFTLTTPVHTRSHPTYSLLQTFHSLSNLFYTTQADSLTFLLSIHSQLAHTFAGLLFVHFCRIFFVLIPSRLFDLLLPQGPLASYPYRIMRLNCSLPFPCLNLI